MRYKLVRLSYQYAEVEASICKIAIYTLKIYCLNLKFSKKLKPLARLPNGVHEVKDHIFINEWVV